MELGDHVCWRVDPADVFTGARSYVADGALYGDKVVVIGSLGAVAVQRDRLPTTSVILGLPDLADSEVMLAAVRREAREAVREGFRSVRVLAERTPVTTPSDAEELMARELKLEEFASESGAIVVCAFRAAQWEASTLEQAACVHPQEMGTRAARPAFRMFSTGTDSWSVDGVVDSECAAAFNAAIRGAVRRTHTLKLRFDALEMIDAAGMHALVDAAHHLPGRRIVVEGANEIVRLCWDLAGYSTADVPVVMAA
ncbi:MEDS domain-containing protein [Streptomyces avidinii]